MSNLKFSSFNPDLLKEDKEVKQKLKTFLDNIKVKELREKFENYFSFLSNQDKSYFELRDEKWNIKAESQYSIDREEFFSENTWYWKITFNKESFDTIVTSIIQRRYLASYVEDWAKKDTSLDIVKEKELKEKFEEFMKIEPKTYDKLLSLPRAVRLDLCTKNHTNIDELKSRKVKKIEFDFKFGEKNINKEIYLNTTAGQLLPAEVRTILKNGVVYKRSWLKWEFFEDFGKRLTIHQGTNIVISEFEKSENIKKEKNEIKEKLNIESEEKISLSNKIRLEASLRWIEPDFAVIAFKDTLEKEPEEKRKYVLENMLTDFDRIRGIYRVSWELNKNWKYDDRLALEMFSQFWWKNWKDKAKSYWINKRYIEDKTSIVKTNIMNENIVGWEITQEDIDKINKIKKFKPWSKEAITLFKIACKIAKIDDSWADNPHLHKIMSNESAWVVGRLNYTIKWISLSQYKAKALKSDIKNPIGSKSTASGLGQLLLSNIDKFYPNGRKWIWNPIEEAVGFIKYIEDRYWNPDVAMSVYWKKWNYTNSKTWKKEYKWFKEWY